MSQSWMQLAPLDTKKVYTQVVEDFQASNKCSMEIESMPKVKAGPSRAKTAKKRGLWQPSRRFCELLAMR